MENDLYCESEPCLLEGFDAVATLSAINSTVFMRKLYENCSEIG